MLTIWDQSTDPPETIAEVLFWRRYASTPSGASIPAYLEDHADRFKAQYLSFVHDLGESQINGRRVIDHLDIGDGFSLWWMTEIFEKNPIKSPRIYDCLRLMALEDILLKRRPSALTLVSSDGNLTDAIQRLCENLGISFVPPRRRPRFRRWSSWRSFYRDLPQAVQGPLGFAKHIALHWRLRQSEQRKWFSGQSAICISSYFAHLDIPSCEEGQFYSRLWGPLPRYTQSTGRRINWLQHYVPGGESSNPDAARHRVSLFNQEPEKQGHHAFLSSYLSARIVGAVIKDWLRLLKVKRRLRGASSAFVPKNSAASFWPFLQADWTASLVGPVAFLNLLSFRLFKAALQSMPVQAIGLYLYEGQGWERAFLHAWRANGHGRIIGVAHATIAFWYLSYFDDPRRTQCTRCPLPAPDQIAVNGPMAAKSLGLGNGANQEVVEVEALRYLGLADLCEPERPRGKSKASVLRILVLGDIVADSTRQILGLLQSALKTNTLTCRVSFKAHPAAMIGLDGFEGIGAVQTTATLDEVLPDHDVVLAANSTSAAVEAFLAGLTVVVALDGSTLNLSPLRAHPGVFFAGTPDELIAALMVATQRPSIPPQQREFFHLDRSLARWDRMLNGASN